MARPGASAALVESHDRPHLEAPALRKGNQIQVRTPIVYPRAVPLDDSPPELHRDALHTSISQGHQGSPYGLAAGHLSSKSNGVDRQGDEHRSGLARGMGRGEGVMELLFFAWWGVVLVGAIGARGGFGWVEACRDGEATKGTMRGQAKGWGKEEGSMGEARAATIGGDARRRSTGDRRHLQERKKLERDVI